MTMAPQDWFAPVATAAASGLVVLLLLPPLIAWLTRRAVMDIPNARSSHVRATPRGGGIALVAGILFGNVVWLVLQPDTGYPLAVLGMVALAVISWLDDRHGGLPVMLRLGMQVLVVGVVLALFPANGSMTTGLVPVWIERVVLFFAWIWFINLFNFMDGINGISGVEMVSIGLGAALLSLWQGEDPAGQVQALVLAAAALGFLPWNWGRARVFLGDVGSVPAGFMLGLLLLTLVSAGQWAAALILPMYYWVDATLTLLRRLLRREKVWQAHRSHFYQRGADRLGSHAAVAGRIALLNVALIGLALASTLSPAAAVLAVAAALVLALLLCKHFAGPAKPVV